MFFDPAYSLSMTGENDLKPATPDEIELGLAYALMFDGRKRTHNADELMARITAQRLVKYLDRAGYIVMKKPPGRAPTTSS